MPIVDAHPHIYAPDRNTFPTIEDPWEPGEPASAEDLKKMMDVVGVDRAIFIQTSTFYGHDNRYIMAAAKEHADWACGVVTLDPDDGSHVDLLEQAVKDSNIRGMRGTTDSLNRITTPNVYRLWTRAMELGIPVNCMVMDDLERVPEIERIAQDLGDLKIVIDHCFMLNTRHKTEETLAALERLAKLPNIYAKLTSGTHGSYRVYPYPDMHDPLKRVIAAFGPDRCVWGSNFPNALWSKGATYAQNLHLFVKELGLSLPDKAGILGVTAMSLWFPDEYKQEERVTQEQQERTERESIEAQEADEDEVIEGEVSDETKGHKAQITQMADLIAAQGVVEGPIVDEVDGVELDAILKAASDLNAVLDKGDFGRGLADVRADSSDKQDDFDSSPEPLLNFAHGEDSEADSPDDMAVNVDELLAAQENTPVEPHNVEQPQPETGRMMDPELDMSSIQAAADELNAALESEETPVAASVEADDVESAEKIASAESDSELNLTAMMDVADQLSTMLESVDHIAADINDLSAEADDVDDQGERPSA